MDIHDKKKKNPGWPRKTWNRITSLFGRRGEGNIQKAVVSSDSAEDFQQQFKDEFKRLHDAFMLNLKDEGIVEVVTRHVMEISSGIYQLFGTYHGKNGSKFHQVRVSAVSQATQITEHVSSKVKGKIKGYEGLLLAKTRDQENDTLCYDREREKYEDFLDYSQKESRHFSRTLLWTYLVLSIVLVLADLPVSLSLVGFFNIGNTGGKAEFIKKLQDPELLLFSLGICFSSVLVKIIWDEYVNNKLGSTRMAFDKLKNSHSMSMSAIRGEYFLKLVVKLLVLGGLFFTLYNLGKFRNAFSRIVFTEEALRREHQLYDITFWSFVGITVVIPIISGICLSLGLSILSNIRNLKDLRRSRDECFMQLTKTREEVEKISRHKAELEEFAVEWKDKPHKIKIISDLFVSSYEGAYKAAFLASANRDYFRMAELLHYESLYDRFTNKNTPKL